MMPSGKPEAACWYDSSKYQSNVLEVALFSPTSRTILHDCNVGDPRIAFIEIAPPKPKDNNTIFPLKSVYLVLYVTTADSVLASFSAADEGTAKSKVIG